MPGDATAVHPNGTVVTFTESDHSYIDNMGMDYTSVTTLIHGGFPAFNAQAAAARKSIRTGRTPQSYIDEWEENRTRAALMGTRMHENCEYQILGQYDRMHQPTDANEKKRFAGAWDEVTAMLASQPRSIEPEKIIFSPRYVLAGSIDLLMQRRDETFVIGDWKLLKELKKHGFNGETGNIFATHHLENCNYNHYSLQLSIYQMLLKMEGYIPRDAMVERWLFICDVNTGEFRPEPVPFLSTEAALLLAEHCLTRRDDRRDVPF